MAKRRKNIALEDLDRLSQISALSEDEKIRHIRELERKVAEESTARKELKKQYDLTLADLNTAEQVWQQFLATQNIANEKKLIKLSKHGKGKGTAVICLNDWHIEEHVAPETVNHLNEFNLEIADARIKRTIEWALYLLDVARGLSNIQDMVVWLGGDLINGYIHEEMIEGNLLGPTEAMLLVQDYVVMALQNFLKQGKVRGITVVTSLGNHGRTTKKRRLGTAPRTHYEYLAYRSIAKYFTSEPKIAFKIGEGGYHNFLDIQGHTVRFHHGDAIKYNGGIGGVQIPLRKKIAQWNKAGKPPYLDVLGHFHQSSDDWNFVLSGCLVGYNAYAVEIGAECQRPSQAFFVIDREEGKIMSMPIFCSANLPNPSSSK
jgi:hypothetical protein